MKHFLLILFATSLISVSSLALASKNNAPPAAGQELSAQVSEITVALEETSAEPATCTGADPCRACKNCKYCKYCSKDGGSCGVCRSRKSSHH